MSTSPDPRDREEPSLARLLARLERTAEKLAPDELTLVRDYRLLSIRDRSVVRALIKTLLKED